jgi:hypothetical protein
VIVQYHLLREIFTAHHKVLRIDFMKTRFILIVILFFSVQASGEDRSVDAFEEIKGYFISIPERKDFRKIERELRLPHPDKTYVGSSSYRDRRFRYNDFRGLMLQIGLKQECAYKSYEEGKFSFNGDFWIIGDGREYVHCCFDDGHSSIYDGPIRR